ncbi:MAG: IPT/TIG domain-containing protein [Bacteroidota bacterium]
MFTVTTSLVNRSDEGNTYFNVPLEVELVRPNGSTESKQTIIVPQLNRNEITLQEISMAMPEDAVNGTWGIIVQAKPARDTEFANNISGYFYFVGPQVSENTNVYQEFRDRLLEPPQEREYEFQYGSRALVYWGVNTAREASWKEKGDSDFRYYTEGMVDLFPRDDMALATEGILYTSTYRATQISEWTELTGTSVANGAGPRFDYTLIEARRGEVSCFRATNTGGHTFGGSDDDHVFFENNTTIDYRTWYDSYSHFDSQQGLEVCFRIPNDAAFTTHELYLQTNYDGNSYLTQLNLWVRPPRPVLESISASVISADDILTLFGEHFGSSGTVLFGDLAATDIISWTADRVECVVPEGVADGLVRVVSSDQASESLPFQVLSSTGDPTIVRTIADQTAQPLEWLDFGALAAIFSDPNDDPLAYTFTSSPVGLLAEPNQLADGFFQLGVPYQASGVYSVAVTATDADAAEHSISFQVFVHGQPIGDSIRPAAPYNLTARTTEGQVKLSWSANSELDLARYELYRSESEGETGAKLADVQVDQISYVDNTVANDIRYYYHVLAVDYSGNISRPSNIVSARSVVGIDPIARYQLDGDAVDALGLGGSGQPRDNVWRPFADRHFQTGKALGFQGH